MTANSGTIYEHLPYGYRLDRRLGPVYDMAPSRADDLTLIRGIDTREAVILNRIGVYFHSQIATWDETVVCAMAEELGMNPSSLIDEQWPEQAVDVMTRPLPPVETAPRPAGLFRTTLFVACAVIFGCGVVYWMNTAGGMPMTGVVTADITSLRVPVNSRLLQVKVEVGQEVHSGDELLTLEKTAHLKTISLQEKKVSELTQQLEQAEAKAELELAWRREDIDSRLTKERTRARLMQEVNRKESELKPETDQDQSGIRVTPVGESRTIEGTKPREKQVAPQTPNGMYFFSGESNKNTHGVKSEDRSRRPSPPKTVQAPATAVQPASESAGESAAVSAEVLRIQQRLEQLESMRDSLPRQVRTAAGVETLRLKLDEESQKLKEMQTVSRDSSVLCPSYGRVGQIRYKAGDTMTAGEVMLKILHSDRRYVILNVPAHRINEVAPGNTVGLVFPGGEQFRGTVSNMPMLAESDGSQITVRVDPCGRVWPAIPIGSQIEVVTDYKSLF